MAAPPAGGDNARSKPSIRERRNEAARRRTDEREARWREHRYAVPYRTDGPRITKGVLWFAAVLGSVVVVPWLTVFVVATAAAIAGLQTAYAWEDRVAIDRRASAGIAAFVAGSGWFGALGVGIGTILAVIIAGVVVAGHGAQTSDDLVDRTHHLVRCSLPAGLAAASIPALASIETGAVVALVVLVSAYEAGDFLIGSGSSNAVEGPVAGVVALAIVSSALFLLLPAPFTTDNFPLFVVLAAAACPLGQIFGSAILPQGDAWSPGLRRLDSYLLAGPLFLLLLRPVGA